jgi:hypothetical protein
MLKAVLRQGVIVPLEPLPQEWQEGTSLAVERADDLEVDIDTWAKAMELLCADSSAEQEEEMRHTIDEHRRQAKDQMRRSHLSGSSSPLQQGWHSR